MEEHDECKIYELNVSTKLFNYIKSGKKTIDVLAGSLAYYQKYNKSSIKYYDIIIGGDRLSATSEREGDTVTVHVINVVHYDNFSDLLQGTDWRLIGPQFNSEEELLRDLMIYWSIEMIAFCGGLNTVEFQIT